MLDVSRHHLLELGFLYWTFFNLLFRIRPLNRIRMVRDLIENTLYFNVHDIALMWNLIMDSRQTLLISFSFRNDFSQYKFPRSSFNNSFVCTLVCIVGFTLLQKIKMIFVCWCLTYNFLVFIMSLVYWWLCFVVMLRSDLLKFSSTFFFVKNSLIFVLSCGS